MIESKHPEKAASYYLLASDTAMIEDRPQHACEYACKSKVNFLSRTMFFIEDCYYKIYYKI